MIQHQAFYYGNIQWTSMIKGNFPFAPDVIHAYHPKCERHHPTRPGAQTE